MFQRKITIHGRFLKGKEKCEKSKTYQYYENLNIGKFQQNKVEPDSCSLPLSSISLASVYDRTFKSLSSIPFVSSLSYPNVCIFFACSNSKHNTFFLIVTRMFLSTTTIKKKTAIKWKKNIYGH